MEQDPFITAYNAAEIEIAAEFLNNWLPFLTRGLCDGCSTSLSHRIRSLHPASPPPPIAAEAPDPAAAPKDPKFTGPRGFEQIEPSGWDTEPERTPDPPPPPPSGWDMELDRTPENPKVRMSWADMAQEEDELEEEEEEEARRRRSSFSSSRPESREEVKKKKPELSREQREQIRFRSVERNKDFICLERVNGRITNILSGLELHTGIFSAAEQKRIVDFVYELQDKGRNHQFGEHTYSQPRKWMRGKGRVTIQFGCCYNYAMQNGVPPGILKNVLADPLPPLFKVIIRRLVRWHVLPTSCVPDSCIVNIYEPGDCIPPHIDSHDFVRPFCTVSFLSECNILFGSNLKIAGPGEFTGSFAIPLPMGSVLVLNGNGADVAKHCVPAVPTKRISITFRKMDENKWPVDFIPEPDLQDILPLSSNSGATVSQNHAGSAGLQHEQLAEEIKSFKKGKKSRGRPSMVKPETEFHHSHHHSPYDLGTPTQSSPHPDVDTWLPMSSKSMERGRETAGRWFEPKPFGQGLLGASPHEESGSLDGSREQGRRRARLEQKRTMISHNVEGEKDSFQKGPIDEESSSILEGSKEYSGRRVLFDQKRIVITRNVAGEEEPMRMGGRRISEPGHISRVSVRSLSNGRRRVRGNLSDG